MKIPCVSVRRYCADNRLFTCGSNEQYNRMLELVKNGFPLHDIATMIWICSETDKTAADIDEDLKRLAVAGGEADD